MSPILLIANFCSSEHCSFLVNVGDSSPIPSSPIQLNFPYKRIKTSRRDFVVEKNSGEWSISVFCNRKFPSVIKKMAESVKLQVFIRMGEYECRCVRIIFRSGTFGVWRMFWDQLRCSKQESPFDGIISLTYRS